MNLDCRDIEPLVQSYLDREMAEPQARLLLDHLERCPHCRAEFHAFVQMIRACESAPAPEAPGRLYDRVLAELPPIEPAPPVKHSWRSFRWVSSAAAAAAILLVALYWPAGGPPQGLRRPVGPNPVPAQAGSIDPVSLLWMAVNRLMVPGGGDVAGGLAGGAMARLRAETARPQPVRIVVCFRQATPIAESPVRLVTPGPTVWEVIPGGAVYTSGQTGGQR